MSDETIEDFPSSEIELNDDRVPNIGYALVCSLFAFLFSIGSCYFALFSISFNKGLSSIPKEYQFDFSLYPPLLPTKFLIPHSMLFPVNYSDENNSFTYTSLIYIFEAQFRNKAIQKGIFTYRDYLEFSTVKYIDKVKAISNTDNVTMGLYLSDHAHVGEGMSILFNTSEYQNVIIPNHNTALTMDKNPFIFEIQQSFVMRGLESIKQKLVNSSQPLLFSFRIPRRKIRASCNEIGKCTPCINKKLCKSFILKDRNLNFGIGGVYIPGDPATLPIVGYNDNIEVETEKGTTRGGLILRGRKPGIGHSYEYLTDQITLDQDAQLCNSDNVVKGDVNCLKNATTAGECNATPLKCIDKRFCNRSSEYALSTSDDVVELGVGVIDMSFIPKTLISNVLFPNKNITERCGYFFLPYYVINEMEKNPFSTFSNEALSVTVDYPFIQYQNDLISKIKKTFSNISFNLFEDIPL